MFLLADYQTESNGEPMTLLMADLSVTSYHLLEARHIISWFQDWATVHVLVSGKEARKVVDYQRGSGGTCHLAMHDLRQRSHDIP